MSVRLLPQTLINQIAAGEVVERPSSVIKELVENALDANATQIDVLLFDGGKASISVIDNGVGMDKDDLVLSVERHATSKLPNEDLFDIHFFGFRGEALPSIASVSRVTLTSKTASSDTAWQLQIDGGSQQEPSPVSAPFGTRVDVKDLFYAVPARLKFLKSAQTETSAVQDILERLALVNYAVGFTLTVEQKRRLDLKPASCLKERVADILGKDFTDNALEVSQIRCGVTLQGFISLPTYNRATSADQYFFVNGRLIKDKTLFAVTKVGYHGLLASDRYPVVTLFIDVPKEDIDVNVHPNKTEVRFKDLQNIRNLLIGTIQSVLSQGSQHTSSEIATQALDLAYTPSSPSFKKYNGFNETRPSPTLFKRQDAFSAPLTTPQDLNTSDLCQESEETFPPLGFARAQLHHTYVIAQTKEGILVVDQHASCERLLYEKIITALETSSAPAQYLLLPEIISLSDQKMDTLIKHKDDFEKMGLMLEAFGQGTVLVRATPALLGEVDVKGLIIDLADTLIEWGALVSLKERLKDVCAKLSCHGSIRAGRKLSIPEMNDLLRAMETVPHSGQCIHGRPTYIELKLKDIEKLFGRRG